MKLLPQLNLEIKTGGAVQSNARLLLAFPSSNVLALLESAPAL
jgi:hypothetical protein